MALFRKKEKLDIPEIPSLPEFSDETRERGLPSLPSGFNEDVNRNIIKSAINEDSIPSLRNFSQEETIPSLPTLNSEEIIPEHKKFLPEKQMSTSIYSTDSSKINLLAGEGSDSIFVRIDKFRAAKKEISTIKKSLLEAETIINKIREIKIKEDSEISDINMNLDTIKKKIGDVDSLVFDKV